MLEKESPLERMGSRWLHSEIFEKVMEVRKALGSEWGEEEGNKLGRNAEETQSTGIWALFPTGMES